MTTAEKWREYKREYNALLKKNHLCRDCKAQDGRTLNGFVLCWDCHDRDVKRQRERAKRPEVKAQKRADAKQLYASRKEQGLCPVCGRERSEKTFVLCKMCRAKNAKKKRIKQVQMAVNRPRGANGYCFYCNKKPAENGLKTCQECHEKLQEAARHVNQFRKGGFKPIVFGKGRFKTNGKRYNLA